MDHTHNSPVDGDGAAAAPAASHPVDALAGMDPAEAPAAAEQYARELAGELEEAGAVEEPVQLRADWDGPPTQSTPRDSV